MRVLLDDGQDFDQFEELLNRFIRALSIVELRVHHHRNSPTETLESWSEDRYVERQEFREETKQLREQVLEGHELDEILTETVADSYNDAVLDMIADMDRASD